MSEPRFFMCIHLVIVVETTRRVVSAVQPLDAAVRVALAHASSAISATPPQINFIWAKTWAGEGSDDGPGVAVDSLGNVYVRGMYGSQTINFDPAGGSGGLGHPAHDSGWIEDVFLNKFASDGTYQWVKTWGASGTDEIGETLTVDRSNNVYIGGRFGCATCDFNPGPGGTADIHSSHGNLDAFVSKFDSAGNFQGAQTWGGTGEDGGNKLARDATGNVYVAGWFHGTVDFDLGSGVDNHTAIGVKDAFFSKFLPSLKLWRTPGDQTIYLNWNLNITVPVTSTWQISYTNGLGSAGVVFDVLSSRAHTLSGLTNCTWYTVTLNAMLDTAPILTDTVQVMPAKLLYLPLVQR